MPRCSAPSGEIATSSQTYRARRPSPCTPWSSSSARSASRPAAQRAEQHARAAAEPLDLDPGVLAEHPAIAARASRPNSAFAARILDVRRAALGRIVLRVEELERPAVERVIQLAELVLVRRGEYRPDQFAHRTPSTGSRRISSAVTASGCVFSTCTSSATRRRSRASSTSNARTATPRDLERLEEDGRALVRAQLHLEPELAGPDALEEPAGQDPQRPEADAGRRSS